MLCLYLQAPFATFRTFMVGSFRTTAGFITPSAAYGLLLNAAGIEMREDDGKSPMTQIKRGLPMVKIAIGALEFPLRHSLLQQIHNYPIGTTGSEHADDTKGNKYNVLPANREFLSNIRAYILMDGNQELERRVQEGLDGNETRSYGLLFLGDNNFLIDRFEHVERPDPAYWFEKIEEDQEGMKEGITRLTITIDRSDASKTRTMLFAPIRDKENYPTQKAWVEVNYP